MLKTFALECLSCSAARLPDIYDYHDLQLSLKYNFRLDRLFGVR
jgi:hypothetical protein